MSADVVPFWQFVLKVCTRCDLACDHRHVYEQTDQSWRVKPKVIADDMATAAAVRIASSTHSHMLAEVRVILNGGMPLPAGRSRLALISVRIRELIEPVSSLDLRVYTKEVLLDEKFRWTPYADWLIKVHERWAVDPLPGADFAALAAGFGDERAIGALAAAHLSVTRTLLGQVRDQTTGTASADAAWEVLFTLDPATLDELLAYPYIRVWATRCVREPAAHLPGGRLPGSAIGDAERQDRLRYRNQNYYVRNAVIRARPAIGSCLAHRKTKPAALITSEV